jgi:hypothetical protein
MLLQPNYSQSTFWKNIKVRKAFETKTEDDDKAANFSFTVPEQKSNYFVVNAGIGYEFADTSKETKNMKAFKNSFTGFFVYNKNNQIDKEQYNYKLGVSSSQIFYTNTNASTAIFGTNTIQFLRNFQDTTHSILLTSYWHPFLKNQNCIKFWGYTQTCNLFAYYFMPQAGLEYQNILEAKKSAMKGYDFRGYFSIGASLLLKKKTYDDSSKVLPKNRWTKGIELKVTYDGRVSFLKNLDSQDTYIPMFKSELILYPTKDNNLSIGLSYNNGANPVDGIAKQTFWLFAFKYKK